MRNVKKLILGVTACLCVNSTVLAYPAEIDGFNNMRWSTPIQYMTDIKYLGKDMGFTYYNTDMSHHDGIPVSGAQVVFLEGQLVEVNFKTNFANGYSLMNKLVGKHGKPIDHPKYKNFSYWVGDSTIISGHKLHDGVLFTFRSRQLIEKQIKLEGGSLSEVYPH